MLKRNLTLLYGMSLLQGMVFYGSVATLYRTQHGLTVFHITLIEGVSLALALLLEIPWGFVADRIGYKRALMLSCAVYFVSKLVFWQARGFADFLIERLLLAVAVSGISGCDAACLYVSMGSEPERRAKKVFGVYNAMGQAGLLFAALAFSFFVKNNLSLSALLTVFSYGAAFVLVCFLTPVRPPAPEQRVSPLPALRLVLCDRRFLLFLVGGAMLAEAGQTIPVFLAQLQYVAVGIPISALGFLLALSTLAGMLSVFTQRLSKSLGERRLTVLLFLAAISACLALCFAPALGEAAAVVSIAAVPVLVGAVSMFYPLRLELQNRQAPPQNRATVLSAHAMVLDAVAIATNLLYGRAADFALWLPMALGAALCALGLALVLTWLRISRPETQKRYERIP